MSSMRTKIEEAYKELVTTLLPNTALVKRVRVPFYVFDELPDSLVAMVYTASRTAAREIRSQTTNRLSVAISLVRKAAFDGDSVDMSEADEFDVLVELLIDTLSKSAVEVEGVKYRTEEGAVEVASSVQPERELHGIMCETLILSVPYYV